MADAPEVPWTPFMHPVPRGWGGNCVDPPITFPPQRPPLCQISSGSVQRFGFLQRIDKHTDIALYVLENGHIVLLVLLCMLKEKPTTVRLFLSLTRKSKFSF